MQWHRGHQIGHGSFGHVNLAIPTKDVCPNLPRLMAVKSCSVFNSISLINEREILSEISGCENVIKCYGGDYSYENGENLYNLFLEYASNGSLSDLVENSGGKLSEFKVRRFVKEILNGVKYIHGKGFVHCDIKLQNILLCSENGKNVVKIADFGLSKRSGEKSVYQIRGTPVNMSPESLISGDYEAPADIWAIGCAIVEMVTGKPAWRFETDCNVKSLLLRIGAGDELPEIPKDLSDEGKDFLRKCFVKDPAMRWTAEMLLDHPFVNFNGGDDRASVSMKGQFDEFSNSPKCPFDFPDWVSTQSSPGSKILSECNWNSRADTSSDNRIRQLVNDDKAEWLLTTADDWVTVR